MITPKIDRVKAREEEEKNWKILRRRKGGEKLRKSFSFLVFNSSYYKIIILDLEQLL